MKTAFFVVLAITAATAENIICQPGALFKVDCNSCTCAQDGRSMACTDMVCPPSEVLIDQRPKYCTPGSFFEVDCNTCTCSEDGTFAACTDMVCPPKEKIVTTRKSKQICEPRSQFKDYCNTCYCSEDGTSFGCTMMECDKDVWNKDGTKKFVARASGAKQVCEPNTQFKQYCNTCFCSADGTSFGCTFMDCDESIWNEDGTLKSEKIPEVESAPKQVCTPLSQFKDYCNTCNCAKDGLSYACTKMYCDKDIWNKDGTTKVQMKNLLSEETSAPKQVCTPRSQFKDYCNTCFCSADGMSYGCTRMYCDKSIWNKDGSSKLEMKNLPSEMPKQVCKPLTTYKDYCNTCFCSADGLSATCTRMYCDKAIWNKNGTSKIEKLNLEAPKQVCQPLSQFKEYCNTCTCTKDGLSYACTKMFCDKNIWNKNGTSKLQIKNLDYEAPKQVCKPLSQFKEYCNTCTCTKDGLAYACTKMFCDKNIWNKNGTSKLQIKNLDYVAPKQVCTPFTTFKDYCNTCNCAADGLTAACTRMYCDKNIWNKDGTTKVQMKNLQSESSAPKQVCTPFTTFKDYCNTCNCAADGLTAACTRMYCDKNIWNKDGTTKVQMKNLQSESFAPKQVCQPHKSFKLYCNTCFCSADGLSFGCTRMFCDKSIWNKNGSLKKKQVCQPGSTYKVDDCNTCVCNEDGTDAACTFELCPTKNYFKRENTENWGPVYKQGDACNPGKIFYSECNRCVCTKSGNSAFCTLMNC